MKRLRFQDISFEEFHRVVKSRRPFNDASDSEVNKTVEKIQGKWKIRILFELSRADSFRYNELKRYIPSITNTMLTSTLRELEADGLVLRRQYNEIPPRVEYSLTERGRGILPIFYELFKWALKDMEIRTVCRQDLEAVLGIALQCGEPTKRTASFFISIPKHFWMFTVCGRPVAFSYGPVSRSPEITCEILDGLTVHDEAGPWQTILQVSVLPEFENTNYGGLLLSQTIEQARRENRLGVVMLCPKERMYGYGEYGFADEGPVGDGGRHRMRLTF